MRERLPPPLRERDFSLLWATNILAGLATQMILVAVGWQVYAIHRDPLDLGLIGLVEFVPLLLLALPAGQLADVVPRRAIIAVSLGMEVAIALLLLAVTIEGGRTLWPYLALAAASGVAAGISAPALRALLPETVPTEMMAGAMALRSVGWQMAVVTGPAVGGIIFEVSPKLLYALSAGLFVAGLGCVLALQRRPAARAPGSGAPGLQSLIEGIGFLRRSPMVLGAILLDLFAVLFGGAIALAPVFARSILHVGPVGLGALRTAPAVGALLAALMLTRRPLRNRPGRRCSSSSPSSASAWSSSGCPSRFRSRLPPSRSPGSWT